MTGQTLRLILLTGILAGISPAADLTSAYTWKPINLGAGGYADGMLISQTDPNVRFVRTDTGQYYRWSVPDQKWLPMVVQNDDGSGFGKAIIPEPSQIMPAGGNDGGSFALDPNDNQTIYLYLPFGDANTYGSLPWNVYKSTDGGKNFSATHFIDAAGFTLKTNDTFARSFRVDGECLAVDPNNSKVVYIGTGTKGLFKSTDGGNTWSAMSGGGLPVPVGKHNINILPYKNGGAIQVKGVSVSKIIYLVMAADPAIAGVVEKAPVDAKAGIVALLKVDEKTTLNLATTGITADALKGEVDHKVFVTGVKNGLTLTVSGMSATPLSNVYQSSDGGQTWTNLTQDSGPSGVCHAGVLDPNNGILYVPASSSPAGLWKYDGAAWTKLPAFASCVAVDPTNSNNLVAVGSGTQISTNAGQTWTTFVWTPHLQSTQTQGFAGSRHTGAYNCPGTVRMDTTGTVWWIGANDGVYTWKFDPTIKQSTDILWTPNTAGVENFCSMDIVFPKNWGGKAIVSVQDEDAMVVNNLDTFDVTPTTETWLNNGMKIAVCPNDPNTFAIISYVPRITSDGGRTYTLFKAPDKTKTNAIAPYTIPPDLGFGCLQISRRGNWSAGSDHLVWLNGKVSAYSSDGGKTWQRTTTTNFCASRYSMTIGPWSVNHNLVADPFTPDKFYVYFDDASFWTTTDGGATWTKGNSPEGHPGVARLCANDAVQNDLWLSTGSRWVPARAGIYHSADAGATWQKVADNGSIPLTGPIALGKGRNQPGDAPYTVYCVYSSVTPGQPARDYGIYRSNNAGASWDRIGRWPYGLTCGASGGISASWDTFGLVGVGMLGQGFVYGKPKNH